MSKTILQNARVCAALFSGPRRPDGGDNTMVQIEDLASGEILAIRLDDFREIALRIRADLAIDLAIPPKVTP